MVGLSIGEAAKRTGIAAGTIRMWEQRYGFPHPNRTAGGYRQYSEADVRALQKVVAHRRRGLSIPAAIERAKASSGSTDRPSIYAAVAAAEPDVVPHQLLKPTLLALSNAMEDETIARAAAPLVFSAFQERQFYEPVRPRYERMAEAADGVVVFADWSRVRCPAGKPCEVPIAEDDVLGNEWALIVDAPGYAACLLAWEHPDGLERGGPEDDARRFEAFWTIDPQTVRRASTVAARLVARQDEKLGASLERMLEDRPLAMETPAPALTSLTNRIVEYLEAA